MTPAVPSPQIARLITKTRDDGAVALSSEPHMKIATLVKKIGRRGNSTYILPNI